jgi:aspartyl-tRNA(Asn)/glutamyl-tRNA(Gln) amidotransferase subunit C
VYHYAAFFPVFYAIAQTSFAIDFAGTRAFKSQYPLSTPMSLEAKDVANIAHLARLAITEQEMPVYASGLSKIIKFVEQLDAADVASVQPMAHPLAGQVQRLRSDEITEADEHEKYQQNAPRVEASLYLVPKVIE